MADSDQPDFVASYERWERETLTPMLKQTPEQERNADFTTMSGQIVKPRLYAARPGRNQRGR